MHRFFVPHSNVKDKKVYITDKNELRHIEKVLRLGVGDKAIVFDGQGGEYEVTIAEIDKDSCLAIIDNEIINAEESKIHLSLIQGIAKGDKMDTIVQKAVEVGVSSIYPILTEHTVVKLDTEKSIKKVQRWQSIAIEACKQCRRNTIPKVYPITTWERILPELTGKVGVMLYEGENKLSLRDFLQANNLKGEIFIIVGPEGGFSDQEVAKARDNGILIVTMGQRILRTETAGLVGAAIVLYEAGDLG